MSEICMRAWRKCDIYIKREIFFLCVCVQGGTGSPCERLCAKLHSALASGWQKVSSCVVTLKYIYFQALIISSCCLCLCNKACKCLNSEKKQPLTWLYLLCVAFLQMPRGWMECILGEDRLSQTTSETNIRVWCPTRETGAAGKCNNFCCCFVSDTHLIMLHL